MQSQRKARSLNTRFVVRGLLVALGVFVLVLVGVALLPPQVLSQLLLFVAYNQPVGPTPPPPTITAPRGALPAGRVGLVEQAQYQGGEFYGVGSGFLLQGGEGPIVGVTTAHSLDLGNAGHPLQKVAFALSGQGDRLAESDTLYGLPGVPRTDNNLVADYVLVRLSTSLSAVPPNLLLQPDPRGAPQPGERVVVFSGLGDGQGGPRALSGTVQSVEATGVWVTMDEAFDAGGLSGSPLLSAYTGRVVGMALAATYRREHTLMGFHPIGSIVGHIQAAQDFPKIADFRR